MQLTIQKYHTILFLTFLLTILFSGNFSRNSELSSSENFQETQSVKILSRQELPTETRAQPVAFGRTVLAHPTFSAPLVPSKKISLTFDDGPHPGYTEKLLALLKEKGVSATFFVVGKQVEKYPHLLQKIFQDGHEIANHSYSHRDLRFLSPEERQMELGKTHELVKSMTEHSMRYFRPPGGQYNQEVVSSAKERGYEMVLWTIFAGDHENPPASLIKKRVLMEEADSGIVLLHSGIENTLLALPEIIDTLKKRGYQFVTVSGLSSSHSGN